MTRRYLLDTGPASDAIFRRRGVFERIRQQRSKGARIGICLPVLGEIIAGVECSSNRDQNWDVVRRSLDLFVHWPFDKKAAHEYGRLFGQLRRMGRPMQQVDIQVAAVAFSLGNCTVVSSDSDLSAIPGLDVENWSA